MRIAINTLSKLGLLIITFEIIEQTSIKFKTQICNLEHSNSNLQKPTSAFSSSSSSIYPNTLKFDKWLHIKYKIGLSF